MTAKQPAILVKPPETIASNPRYIPNGLKFLFGGLSGMAASCVVQPLDLIKTRMQLGGRGRSSFTVASEIIAKEGFFNLYTGLSAGLLRQATYTTTRLGIFNYLFDMMTERNNHQAPGFGMKMVLGIVAGSVGAFVGTPAEIALIRMTADGRLPPDQRRNYKNVFDALTRIVREEGVTKLWRGATPTVARAAVVNAAQLGTYSQAREIFIAFISEGILLHFCASMVSGLITTIASMPVDIIKTKIQNAAQGQSQMQVVTDIIKNEGVLSLWKGFLPYYARLGPHTVLTFIVLEQLNAAYLSYAGAREGFAVYVSDGIGLHFCASMVSGLVTTIASMPVDIIKTKIQNAAQGEKQVEVVKNLLKNEGIFSLWKGFLPYYARIGPHTVLTFIALEQMNSAYFKFTTPKVIVKQA